MRANNNYNYICVFKKGKLRWEDNKSGRRTDSGSKELTWLQQLASIQNNKETQGE